MLESFNFESGFYLWEKHSVKSTGIELRFYLKNDMNFNASTFYSRLYEKLFKSEWVSAQGMTSEKKSFIRGFIESRGRVDTTAKFISQDYFFNDNNELEKAKILPSIVSLPFEYVNFNARNLQPQFVSGKNKRNAQFRINLFYYAKEIGFLNKYKAEIFNKSYFNNGSYFKDGCVYFHVDLPMSNSTQFIKNFNFFTNNIYEKVLTPQLVKALRKKIGFTDKDYSQNGRDMKLIDIYDAISENKCALCKTTKTFSNKTTGKQDFEIHHMISYCNGNELDQIGNLVKLCPTCHGLLKKNRAIKEEQINAIIEILNNQKETFKFTSSFLGIYDINILAEQIYDMLG